MPSETPPVNGNEAPDWTALDSAHVWHPYTQMKTAPAPLPVVRARGAWLELADGRRLLDGISSWWVTLHGHAEPRLVEAAAAQAAALEQVIFAGFTHEPAARLAAELVARMPPGLERVFFSDDGSTAVEVAMKMAVQHWRHRGEPRRTLFLALENAYHGDTFGAMAAGSTALFHGAFAELLCEVAHLPVPSSETEVEACVAALERALEADGERVAAMIVEPILQGAGGMRIHPPAYLAAVRAATARHGIPLVADEIFTGFGRTGRFLACEHAGIAPDLVCLSKGLTGGMLPLGATIATGAIYDSFLSDDRGRTFFHGHSFTANPIACAVARASLALFDERRTLDRVGRMEALFARRLERLARIPGVAATRGVGGLAVVELASSPRTGSTEDGYLDPRGPRLARRLLDRGLYIRPLGDIVYFLPPFAVTDEECEWALELVEQELRALEGEP